jgi:hypothetical protein
MKEEDKEVSAMFAEEIKEEYKRYIKEARALLEIRGMPPESSDIQLNWAGEMSNHGETALLHLESSLIHVLRQEDVEPEESDKPLDERLTPKGRTILRTLLCLLMAQDKGVLPKAP